MKFVGPDDRVHLDPGIVLFDATDRELVQMGCGEYPGKGLAFVGKNQGKVSPRRGLLERDFEIVFLGWLIGKLDAGSKVQRLADE